MGEFKPMVKMETTEPSVILKLKKGGSATHKRMHAEGAKEGFKPVKKMNGGMMGSMAGSSAMPMGNPVAARAMAAKRMAAKPTPPTRGLPAPSRPAMPPAMPMGRPMMKKGGGVQAELDMHESMPASKAHKGLKTGGASKKHFATGGAVNNSGHAVAMPKKAPSSPVAISELSGTFKKGGRVR